MKTIGLIFMEQTHKQNQITRRGALLTGCYFFITPSKSQSATATEIKIPEPLTGFQLLTPNIALPSIKIQNAVN